MAELTIEVTYALALFEAAKDTGKENVILDEIAELKSMFLREPEFFEFIKTPVIDEKDKKDVIRKVLEGKISKEMLNFLYILIDKRRAGKFFKIAGQYGKLLNDSKNISLGTIYSAVPLDDEQLNIFNEKVSKLINKKVNLINKVDTSIIGGIKIFIEGKVIDATIKKRLTDLEESIRI